MTAPDLVFLDSRDLITCIEKHDPCGCDRLAAEFRKRNVATILTFSNLIESLPRTTEVEYGVEFVRRLERLPHVFVPHTAISTLEFREAVNAFAEGREPQHELPRFATYASYVCTFAPGELPPEAWRRHVDLVPLSKHMEGLLTDGSQLTFDPVHRHEMQSVLEQNRSVLGSMRTNKSVLAAMVESQLDGLGLTVDDFSAFFEWLYRKPLEICPGWRLLQEVFQEFRTDSTASMAKGDVPDLTHIYLVPYTRAATLDRKWREYVGRVTKRLHRDGLRATYPVFRDLAAVRSSLARAA